MWPWLQEWFWLSKFGGAILKLDHHAPSPLPPSAAYTSDAFQLSETILVWFTSVTLSAWHEIMIDLTVNLGNPLRKPALAGQAACACLHVSILYSSYLVAALHALQIWSTTTLKYYYYRINKVYCAVDEVKACSTRWMKFSKANISNANVHQAECRSEPTCWCSFLKCYVCRLCYKSKRLHPSSKCHCRSDSEVIQQVPLQCWLERVNLSVVMITGGAPKQKNDAVAMQLPRYRLFTPGFIIHAGHAREIYPLKNCSTALRSAAVADAVIVNSFGIIHNSESVAFACSNSTDCCPHVMLNLLHL